MTLASLLQIQMDYLTADHARVVEAAESRWIRCGRPTARWDLFDLLGAVLDECAEIGVDYPPILLKRKAALKRGSFVPNVLVAVPQRPNTPPTCTSGNERLVPQCAMCGGRGYILTNTGGTLCDCVKRPQGARP